MLDVSIVYYHTPSGSTEEGCQYGCHLHANSDIVQLTYQMPTYN